MSSCPLTIRHVKVRSLSVDHTQVSWELETTTLDVLDYTFQVLRSEGPEGPWDKLTPGMEDQYFFVDNAVKSCPSDNCAATIRWRPLSWSIASTN